ncbi:MAG: GtrA family protein [Pseudomonadota bacterium]
MAPKTEISRFLAVGGLNFGFTFLIFIIALEMIGIGYLAALLLAWISGNILTYVLNFIWVFQPEAKLTFRGRFFKYLTAGAFSICLNLLALSVLVEFGGYDPFWSQVMIMPFIVIFNFAAAKFWSLRKKETGP